MASGKPEEKVAELERELSALLRVEKLLTRSGSGNSAALCEERSASQPRVNAFRSAATASGPDRAR